MIMLELPTHVVSEMYSNYDGNNVMSDTEWASTHVVSKFAGEEIAVAIDCLAIYERQISYIPILH
ncbi:hypothetical protein RDI58_002888 [Solanum bulbocastanum]|uniref:Uncharacterized protein n=1 Tax=Solanum bulbocastanum TaxID=147425 RepID=A0AAN8U7F7_SOLBU